jgi:hypothetical protein
VGESVNTTSSRPPGGEAGHQKQQGVGTHPFGGLVGLGARRSGSDRGGDKGGGETTLGSAVK